MKLQAIVEELLRREELPYHLMSDEGRELLHEKASRYVAFEASHTGVLGVGMDIELAGGGVHVVLGDEAVEHQLAENEFMSGKIDQIFVSGVLSREVSLRAELGDAIGAEDIVPSVLVKVVDGQHLIQAANGERMIVNEFEEQCTVYLALVCGGRFSVSGINYF